MIYVQLMNMDYPDQKTYSCAPNPLVYELQVHLM